MNLSCKGKAQLSAILLILFSTLLWLDIAGLFSFMMVVIATFTFITQTALHLSGYRNGDVFEAYEDAERTEAQAISNLIKEKEKR